MIVDTDDLPMVQELIMEVLAGRFRAGHTTWTFGSRHNRALRALEQAGLIGWKSGVIEKTSLAWLTDDGRASVLDPAYSQPPDWLIQPGHHRADTSSICAQLSYDTRKGGNTPWTPHS